VIPFATHIVFRVLHQRGAVRLNLS